MFFVSYSMMQQGNLQVLFCRTCWINLFPLPRRGCSTGGEEGGVVRGYLTAFRPPGRSQNEVRWWSEYHLARRLRAAALCTPACWRLVNHPDKSHSTPVSGYLHLPP